MKKVVKLNEEQLTNIIKKVIKEKREPVMIDGGVGWFEMHMNKIERGLYDVINLIDENNPEKAKRVIELIIYQIKMIDPK